MAEFTGRTAGGVTSVTAGDGSITIGGTAAAPTVAVTQSFTFAWTAAQSWTVDDASRATNTDILTVTHTTTSGLFGAANMSVGILMRLEDGAGNTDDAGRVGVRWMTPTSTLEDSTFFVQLRRGGAALADHFTVTPAQMTLIVGGGTLSGNAGIADMATNGANGLFYVKANSAGAYGGFAALNDEGGSGDIGLMALGGSGVGGNRLGIAAARAFFVEAIGSSSPLVIGTASALAVTVSTSDTARWQVGASSGDLVPFLTDTYDLGTSSLRVMDVWTGGRVHFAKGADVASANDMTLGGGGISFDITGAVQINTIATTGWQAGDIVILQFDGAPTVKNLTAGTGAQIELAASADFTASAGDELGLKYNGSTWREIFRTVI